MAQPTSPSVSIDAHRNHPKVFIRSWSSENLCVLIHRRRSSDPSFGRHRSSAGASRRRTLLKSFHLINAPQPCREAVEINIDSQNKRRQNKTSSTSTSSSPWSKSSTKTIHRNQLGRTPTGILGARLRRFPQISLLCSRMNDTTLDRACRTLM